MKQNRHQGDGSGSDVHGSEQQSSSRNPQPAQRDNVVSIMRRMRPWESEAVLEHRDALERASILSAYRGTHASSPDARRLLWNVNAIAQRWVARAADEETLKRVRHALALMMCSADSLEQCGSGL